METKSSAAGGGSTYLGLYPVLDKLGDHNDDLITTLVEPKHKRPSRPPPPHSHTLPEKKSPFNVILDDNGTDIPGVDATPICGDTMPIEGLVDSSQSLSPSKLSTESITIPPSLTAQEIRWFYQETGKFWQPFSGPDSLAIEKFFTSLKTEDLTSSGRMNESSGSVLVMGDLYDVNVLERTCTAIYWTEKEAWPVLRGYWYEVIGDRWYPVPEDDCIVIEEAHTQREWRERVRADQSLKKWAESKTTVQTDGVSKIKQDDVVLNRLVLEKYEVLWFSNGDVKKLKKEISTQLWNKVGAKLGKGQRYGASILYRGYKEVATTDGQAPPIGHVVFVIHGIGQTMDASCINKSTSDFRQTCTLVAKRQFGEKWTTRRVEFLPVEWRTWLSLDKGILNTITPQGVKMLRTLFNESVLDVLYYMSPKFGPEIRDGLRFALHKQYSEFMKRHPHFLSDGGTVSVVAHSLGSVILYDLLLETCDAKGIPHCDPTPEGSCDSKKPPDKPLAVEVKENDGSFGRVKFIPRLLSSESKPEQDGDEPDSTGTTEVGFDQATARLELEQLKKRVLELEGKLGIERKPQGLNFFIDHFFALGSPLAVFLMLREHEKLIKKSHKSAQSLLPSCICSRIHNVHHPSDPVAYRLEPLIHPAYEQVKPVRIDSAGSKLSKDAIDHAEGAANSRSKMQISQGKNWFSSFAFLGLGSYDSKEASPPRTSKSNPNPDKIVNSDKKLKEEDKLRERLDFMLKESFTENSYINSLTAHTGYWTSQDCAQYVLLQLYSYKRDNWTKTNLEGTNN